MSELELYESPQGGKDYNIKITVRNGPLLRAIRMRGFKTIAAFAAAAGLSYTHVHPYFTLRYAPIKKGGKWAEVVLSMARYLRLPPDSLFPEQHLREALAHSSGEIEISREELGLLLAAPEQFNPEQQMIEADKHRVLYKMLETLPLRQQQAIKLRYGLDDGVERTLRQVGECMGDLSGTRVSQLIDKGLRKLQRPELKQPLGNAGWETASLMFRFDDKYALIDTERELRLHPPKPKQKPKGKTAREKTAELFVDIRLPPAGHCYQHGKLHYIRVGEEAEFRDYANRYRLSELARNDELVCYEWWNGE